MNRFSIVLRAGKRVNDKGAASSKLTDALEVLQQGTPYLRRKSRVSVHTGGARLARTARASVDP